MFSHRYLKTLLTITYFLELHFYNIALDGFFNPALSRSMEGNLLKGSRGRYYSGRAGLSVNYPLFSMKRGRIRIGPDDLVSVCVDGPAMMFGKGMEAMGRNAVLCEEWSDNCYITKNIDLGEQEFLF